MQQGPEHEGIWLEVTNTRLEGTELRVQLRGDKADKEPVWWLVEAPTSTTVDELYRKFVRTLDKGQLDKGQVLRAWLCRDGNKKHLVIKYWRFQYTETSR